MFLWSNTVCVSERSLHSFLKTVKLYSTYYVCNVLPSPGLHTICCIYSVYLSFIDMSPNDNISHLKYKKDNNWIYYEEKSKTVPWASTQAQQVLHTKMLAAEDLCCLHPSFSLCPHFCNVSPDCNYMHI